MMFVCFQPGHQETLQVPMMPSGPLPLPWEPAWLPCQTESDHMGSTGIAPAQPILVRPAHSQPGIWPPMSGQAQPRLKKPSQGAPPAHMTRPWEIQRMLVSSRCPVSLGC